MGRRLVAPLVLMTLILGMLAGVASPVAAD